MMIQCGGIVDDLIGHEKLIGDLERDIDGWLGFMVLMGGGLYS